jgi:sortase B
MKKVLISLNNETINFRYKVDITREDRDLTKTLMNTNVISNDELIFSDNYLKSNINIMSSFLGELIRVKNISKLVIEEYDIVPIVLDITNSIKYITKLYITPDIAINYKIYEKLLDACYLKYVSCFEIPSFMLEKLCNNAVVVDLRCEIISISNFVYQNNLVNYTKLYYRKTLKIFSKLNKDDFSDFETFCQINRNLRTIYVYDFDILMLEGICKILERTNKRNVRILIHQNLDNSNFIDDNMKRLKQVNKYLMRNCDSRIKIVYGMDYISKYFFRQLSITNIKTCLLIIVFFAFLILFSVKLNSHKVKINNDVQSVDNLSYSTTDDFNQSFSGSIYSKTFDENFAELSSVNPDTRAWLRINNSSINYPVVQSSDNDFYLNHDFSKKENPDGWVFIDYRNNIEDLDKNTIIYGKNIDYNIMFSNLQRLLQESWYSDPSNSDITFDTNSHQFKAKIFSIYTIDTDDYLSIDFSSDDFIEMIKGRSIYDFNVSVDSGDRILTLTTFGNDSDKRIVVHAKFYE